MTYILFWTIVNTVGVSTNSQEFNTKEACKEAESNLHIEYDGFTRDVKTLCTSKG